MKNLRVKRKRKKHKNMKKTVKLLGVAALTAGLAFSMSIGSNKKSSDKSLMELSTQSTANAECFPFDFAGGKCLVTLETCIFAIDWVECDPYKGR